jgi:hypothetical protein
LGWGREKAVKGDVVDKGRGNTVAGEAVFPGGWSEGRQMFALGLIFNCVEISESVAVWGSMEPLKIKEFTV